MTNTAKVQGTAHIYGVDGTITGVTVNGYRDRNFPKLKATVDDEVGREIERRYDDQTDEVELEITLRIGYTVPAGDGSLFVWNSVNYEIQQFQKTANKKNHQIGVITLLKSAQITPA